MPEGARGLIESIPALRNREAVLVGEGVPMPIRIAFDPLDKRQLPASHDPIYSEAWKRTGGERDQLERTIKRWRSQGR